MDVQSMPLPQSAGEARQQAIDWQEWSSRQSLSWGEIADWGGYFADLADRFGLTEEFTENGII